MHLDAKLMWEFNGLRSYADQRLERYRFLPRHIITKLKKIKSFPQNAA